MVNTKRQEYEKRRNELIQINHEQRSQSKPCVLLSPKEIFQIRRTREKDRFKFLILPKHVQEKMIDVLANSSEKVINIGFKVTDTFIKYYRLENIEWTEKGSVCLITLNCYSKMEKEQLERRFKGY